MKREKEAVLTEIEDLMDLIIYKNWNLETKRERTSIKNCDS